MLRQATIATLLSWMTFSALGAPGPNAELAHAARTGDVAEIIRLTRAGADPRWDQTHSLRFPVLLLAAEAGHPRAVQALLAAGAEADVSDRRGTPVLVHAAIAAATHPERPEILGAVQVLLSQGRADPNARDRAYVGDGRSALHVAAAYGHLELARLLLRHGARVDLPNRFGETPLYAAAERGQTDAGRLLLALGADPQARTRYTRMTPLMAAAEKGHSAVVSLLVAHPHAAPGLELRDSFGKTPLERVRAELGRVPAAAPRRLMLSETVRVLESAAR